MKILGIESSCDETGIAIYDTDQGLLSHALYTQIQLHAQYGGVVPELASRDHIRKILPLIDTCLTEAKLNPQDLAGIAYTYTPGLVGALMIGAGIAKSLSLAWNLPTIPVHHMEGHLLAPFLENPQPELPFVALLISGGHTQLYAVKAIGEYTLLGDTLDDAAGEAFDKTAKGLGLPYPGGKYLAELALQGQPRFTLPLPLLNKESLDFSFSGLKTAARLLIEREAKDPQTRADIAASFEQVMVKTLCHKALLALQKTGYSHLIISGGVSANLRLRTTLSELSQAQGFKVFYPRLEFCTDNGAMIALVGALKFKQDQTSSLEINVKARSAL
jgi:N6-L-threonylcarbamoyladenine synthase